MKTMRGGWPLKWGNCPFAYFKITNTSSIISANTSHPIGPILPGFSFALNSYNWRTATSANKNHMTILPITRKWGGGCHSTYFKKKQLSSQTAHNMITNKNPSHRLGDDRTDQWNGAQEKGVNWAIINLNLSFAVENSVTPTQLNCFAEKYLRNNNPKNIPIALHRRTSKIQWSHQHSQKWGHVNISENQTFSKPTQEMT